jgi:uncharacterized membrane protein (Fun14 family)
VNGFSQSARNVVANWFGDGPWRSKSVLAAIAVIAVGLGLWVSNIKNNPPPDETNQATTNAPSITPLDSGSHWNWSKPFPVYVRMGASYVAAYCIGWLFRRVMRLILVAGVLVIALLAYGKFAGWDMTHTQEQVKQGGEWARHTATAEKDHLKGLLPSATAGAVGMFMGFRRRNQAGTGQRGQPRSEAEA